MDVFASDTCVRDQLISILLMLTKSTRFILTCRSGHFSSFSMIFNMLGWKRLALGDSFEILQVLPFDERSKARYIKTATPDSSVERAYQLLGSGSSLNPLYCALEICSSHPGLLAQLTDIISEYGAEEIGNSADDEDRIRIKLISSVISDVMIGYNLDHGRTRDNIKSRFNGWVDLSGGRRESLLSDLAWYMAERRVDTIDLEKLPQYIRSKYTIVDNLIERDIRSQTVFELVDKPIQTKHDHVNRDSAGDSRRHGKQVVDHEYKGSFVGFSLPTTPDSSPDVGASSVTGALFLAKHIMSAIYNNGTSGKSPPIEAILINLGRIALSDMCAAMLRAMLLEKKIPLDEIAAKSNRKIVELAKQGNYAIFSYNYRHLIDNLIKLHALPTGRANLVNPWNARAISIESQLLGLTNYRMVLIPSPKATDLNQTPEPFLLGVHEVTNRQFLEFTSTSVTVDDDITLSGEQWRVERITVAGAGDEYLRSPNCRLTNEYHLFLWMPREHSHGSGRRLTGENNFKFLPPVEIREHPVTYVSWFASAVFCDWLSLGESRYRIYKAAISEGLSQNLRQTFQENAATDLLPGYRLPSAEEWSWAARCGQTDVDYPWDILPCHPSRISENSNNNDTSNLRKEIMLNAGKQSTDVLSDDINDFGLSGMIGNVREWCSDTEVCDDGHKEAVVLGATAYLGERTFKFGYKTLLYPRNTNPDVGFRIARSLSRDEKEILWQRQQNIAGLPFDD